MQHPPAIRWRSTTGQAARSVRRPPASSLPQLAAGYLPLPAFISSWNTSWGTSTLPRRRMRFFPSFCFSSSLRFLRKDHAGGWYRVGRWM